MRFKFPCHHSCPNIRLEKSLNCEVRKRQPSSTARATPILKHRFRCASLEFFIGLFHGDSPDARCRAVMLLHACKQHQATPVQGLTKQTSECSMQMSDACTTMELNYRHPSTDALHDPKVHGLPQARNTGARLLLPPPPRQPDPDLDPDLGGMPAKYKPHLPDHPTASISYDIISAPLFPAVVPNSQPRDVFSPVPSPNHNHNHQRVGHHDLHLP